MRQRHNRLFLLALTIPFAFDSATRTANEGATGTLLRLYAQESADSTHELALHFEISLTRLSWPPWAIVERHQLALQLLQVFVDKFFSQ